MASTHISPLVLKAIALLAPLVSISSAATVASFSFLQAPILRSLAEDDPVTALYHVRWYFETGEPRSQTLTTLIEHVGKYIFPQLSMASGALFSVLAYAHPMKRAGFVVAAVGCLSILPFTSLYMIPTVNNKILAFDDKAKAGKKAEIEAKKEEVSELLERFRLQNLVRAGLFWTGGAIGLYTLLL
jgi:hypothetical protein